MFSYRDDNQGNDDWNEADSPERVPVDIMLDEKMRHVEESERTRIKFLDKICEFR